MPTSGAGFTRDVWYREKLPPITDEAIANGVYLKTLSRREAIAVMASEKLPVQLACRVLNVAESGYYDWRSRPLSARALRHAWLTEQIQAVHHASFGTYGSRRVHAELRLGLADRSRSRRS